MTTLGGALLDAAASDRTKLVFHTPGGQTELTSPDLADQASRCAMHLIGLGVEPGNRVGLLGRNRPQWAAWAYGAWLAGASLVPLQLPIRVKDRQAFADRTASMVNAAGCRIVVAEDDYVQAVLTAPAIPWDIPEPSNRALPTVLPQDDAVIQYTSGSTASPKGAVISHRAVMAQLGQLWTLAQEAGSGGEDAAARVISWVPFFHDLGLFHTLCFPIAYLPAAHLIPTDLYARAPGIWLELATRTRATLMAGPQSAWTAAFKDAGRRGLHLDLSAVRSGLYAADAVDPLAADEMRAVGAAVGLDDAALGSSYGMAEATLAVSATRYGEGLRYRAAPAGTNGDSSGEARVIVSAGRPLEGSRVRAVAPDGAVCPDAVVGELELQTPSVMTGYLDDVHSPIADGWLRSGDLGFVDGGEVFVTGRLKDMMVVLGQNYYPEDFEWAAARVPGVRPGRVVAFMDGTADGIVVAVEADREAALGLAERVRWSVVDALGASPARVLVLESGAVLKTTSGKLQRSATRAAVGSGAVAIAEFS